MFIGIKDLVLLNDISFYLDKLNEEKAKELKKELGVIIEKLELQRISKNVSNAKKISLMMGKN